MIGRGGPGYAGIAMYSHSRSQLDAVIEALQEDVPVSDMTVTYNDKTVPLDHFLSRMKVITAADNHLTAAPIFNVWETLPVGFKQYPDSMGVSGSEGLRLLKRFEDYTWGDNIEMRRTYFSALKTALWVASDEPYKWTFYACDNPGLVKAIEGVLSLDEFNELPSAQHLSQARENAVGIEKECDEIPPERFLDILTLSGWRRMSKRSKRTDALYPQVVGAAKEIIDPLSAVGREAREQYISKRERIEKEKYFGLHI